MDITWYIMVKYQHHVNAIACQRMVAFPCQLFRHVPHIYISDIFDVHYCVTFFTFIMLYSLWYTMV